MFIFFFHFHIHIFFFFVNIKILESLVIVKYFWSVARVCQIDIYWFVYIHYIWTVSSHRWSFKDDPLNVRRLSNWFCFFIFRRINTDRDDGHDRIVSLILGRIRFSYKLLNKKWDIIESSHIKIVANYFVYVHHPVHRNLSDTLHSRGEQ